jgi:hypothetical protein
MYEERLMLCTSAINVDDVINNSAVLKPVKYLLTSIQNIKLEAYCRGPAKTFSIHFVVACLHAE